MGLNDTHTPGERLPGGVTKKDFDKLEVTPHIFGKKLPIIAIVGRPNVGKSTLFNRIIEEDKAIIEDQPGITRDRSYAIAENYPITFAVVDTGGIEVSKKVDFSEEIMRQALLAIEEADIIFCIFDAKAGLHPGDEEVVKILRTFDKKIVYLANKCDGKEQALLANEFYQLGLDNVIDMSAKHSGVRKIVETALQSLPNYEELVEETAKQKELEEKIIEETKQKFQNYIKEVEERDFEEVDEDLEIDEDDQDNLNPNFAPVFVPGTSELEVEEYVKLYSHRKIPSKKSSTSDDSDIEAEKSSIDDDELPSIPEIRVALIGRPNVGKSTLLNTLCGETRAITSPVAGTTRDTLDLKLKKFSQDFVVVDTAGLRKQAKVNDKVERYSVLKTLKAISTCDVVVLLLDANLEPSDQDAKIIGLAHDQGKGILIAVNKWDSIEKDHESVQNFKTQMVGNFKFAPYAPTIFISALSGKRCIKVLAEAKKIAYARSMRVSTGRLNRVLRQAMKKNNPPVYRGRQIKFFFAAQISHSPPRIVLFFNNPKELHFSYQRYLKNALRENFGFYGTDLKLSFKKKESTRSYHDISYQDKQSK